MSMVRGGYGPTYLNSALTCTGCPMPRAAKGGYGSLRESSLAAGRALDR